MSRSVLSVSAALLFLVAAVVCVSLSTAPAAPAAAQDAFVSVKSTGTEDENSRILKQWENESLESTTKEAEEEEEKEAEEGSSSTEGEESEEEDGEEDPTKDPVAEEWEKESLQGDEDAAEHAENDETENEEDEEESSEESSSSSSSSDSDSDDKENDAESDDEDKFVDNEDDADRKEQAAKEKEVEETEEKTEKKPASAGNANDDDDDDDDNEPEDKFPGADDSDSGSSEGEGEGEESQLAVKNSYADAATTVPRDDNESVFVQSQSRSCWAAVAYNLNMWREKTLRWDKGGPGTRGYFRYYVAGAQDCQAMSKLDQCDSTGPNLQQYCLSNPAAGATKAVMDKVVRALQMKSAAYSETKNWTPQQWKSHVSNFGPHLVTVWTSLPSQGPHVAILESVYVPASKPEAAQFYIADVNSGAAGVQADGSRVLSFADFKEEQKKAYDRTSQLETPMDLGAAWFPNPVPKLTCDDPPDTCDCETNEQGLYLKGRSGSEDVCDDWGARNGKADGFAWCYVSKKCAIGKIGSFEGRRWRKCKPGYNGGFVQEKAHGLKVFS